MTDSLSTRIDSALASIATASTLELLDAERVAVVGKSGFVTEQLKQLGKLPAEERKAAGEQINLAKNAVLEAVAARRAVLEESAFEARLSGERIDVTLPGRNSDRANLHPVTRAMDRICEIFARLGYDRVDGPEIEDDWHNFEALNFAPDHPARTMHDTFWFPDGRLLRTHTSPVQIRVMEGQEPPIYSVMPGRVYRNEATDATVTMRNMPVMYPDTPLKIPSAR